MQVNAVLNSKSFILFLTSHLSPNEKFGHFLNNFLIIRRALYSDNDDLICKHASSIRIIFFDRNSTSIVKVAYNPHNFFFCKLYTTEFHLIAKNGELTFDKLCLETFCGS